MWSQVFHHLQDEGRRILCGYNTAVIYGDISTANLKSNYALINFVLHRYLQCR